MVPYTWGYLGEYSRNGIEPILLFVTMAWTTCPAFRWNDPPSQSLIASKKSPTATGIMWMGAVCIVRTECGGFSKPFGVDSVSRTVYVWVPASGGPYIMG